MSHTHYHDEQVAPSNRITERKETQARASARSTSVEKPAVRKEDGNEKETQRWGDDEFGQIFKRLR